VEYICLCNGITDEQVRRAICSGACRPRDVYEAAGHRARCGKCTRDIASMIRTPPPPAPSPACGGGLGWGQGAN